MLLGILVDVGDEMDKIIFGGDFSPAKGVLEEATGTMVDFVHPFGVGIEEVSKLLAG